MSSEVVSVWFEEAKKLNVGQSLFIRVANKKEQTKLANEFEDAREEYATIDSIHASQIFINKTLMERKQYVVLERKYRAIFTAFLRDENGIFTKVSVDPDRSRILSLMLKDGKSRTEIEETLNGLTDEEIVEHFPEK
jgi:hypothetical protein